MDLDGIQVQTKEQIEAAIQELQRQRETLRNVVVQPEVAELYGRITRITQKGSNSSDAVFTVLAPRLNKSYTVVCSFFEPVHENDLIYAVCTIERDSYHGQILRIIRPPFIQPATDKESLIRVTLKVLRGSGYGNTKGTKLCQALEEQNAKDGKQGDAVEELTELASLWMETHDDDLMLPYEHIVTREQMSKLLNWWHKNRLLRRLYLLGLTNREIEACKLPADVIYRKCLSNPYPLVGLTMDKCEEVLARQNKEGTELDKKCGLVVRKIDNLMTERAYCGAPSGMLLQMFPELPTIMEYLKNEFCVVGDYRTVYLEYAHKVESTVAKRIDDLIRECPKGELPSEDCVRSESANFKSRSLTADQKVAIQGALDNHISIIVGSAGSGKTTIISEIIHNLELRDIPYAVASFTGKAVARIREIVKRRAPSTMHRMIARAHATPKFDYLIIDEASMVTTELMYCFFKAFSGGYRIVLVGDPNQLPPISWGAFFTQLIACGRIPTFRLTQNHRVESSLGPNGIMINANALVEVAEDPETPFEFVTGTKNFHISEGSIERVYDILRQLHQNGISANDVTIITPYNRDLDELNATAQQIFNEMSRNILDSRGKLWAVKDRVIMLENSYEASIFNGEGGVITDVSDTEIMVQFGDGAQHVFQLEKKPDASKGSQKGKPKKPVNEDDETPGKETELTVETLALGYGLTVHKCVAGDTFIYTEDGMRRIKDLHAGDKPIRECLFGVHGRYGTNECVQVFKGAVEPSIKITTEHGFILEGSHRHPILVCDENGNEGWKTMPELEVGDTVVMRKGMRSGKTQYVSTESFVEPERFTVQIAIPPFINEDLCYLLGLLVGDGSYVDEGYRIELHKGTKDLENLDEAVRIINEQFGRELAIKESNAVEASFIKVNSKKLRYFFEWCGLNYVKHDAKCTPWVIFDSPLSCQRSYLMGLFDSDGSVSDKVTFKNTAGTLIREAKQLLLNLGVLSGIYTEPPAKDNWHRSWLIIISGVEMIAFQELVGFRNTRKAGILASTINSRVRKTQIGFPIPNGHRLMAGLRDELANHYKSTNNTKRGYMKGTGMSALFSRIIHKRGTLQNQHLMTLTDQYPNISEFGPQGRRIDDYHRNGVFFDKITNIEHSTCQMYDLYIDDETHSFVSNGMISHNSQGSEWQYVIVYIPNTQGNGSFLNRNLIYTAITRAKRSCWIVTCDMHTLNTAAVRPMPWRCDNLGARVIAFNDAPKAEAIPASTPPGPTAIERPPAPPSATSDNQHRVDLDNFTPNTMLLTAASEETVD